MFNIQKIVIEHFVEELKSAYYETYSTIEPDFANIIAWTGRLALENIANSDTLYHNVDHTIMVTLVGQAILKGRHLCEGGVFPRDWLHFMIALLCHDIGYVKGICRMDQGNRVATGKGDETVRVPSGGTAAVLKPYHVDRSQLFVRERFGGQQLLVDIDVNLIAEYIEMTRFPIPQDEFHQRTRDYPALLRGADLIGQLGDPNYLLKSPALFYEFEEIGFNEKTGYTCPGDMRAGYADFYWNIAYPKIQQALGYLHITQEGKQWIANLYRHVFETEHRNSDIGCEKPSPISTADVPGS